MTKLTSRYLNRIFKKDGITIEYAGYSLYRTAMHQTWIVEDTTTHHVERAHSLDECFDKATDFIRHRDIVG